MNPVSISYSRAYVAEANRKENAYLLMGIDPIQNFNKWFRRPVDTVVIFEQSKQPLVSSNDPRLLNIIKRNILCLLTSTEYRHSSDRLAVLSCVHTLQSLQPYSVIRPSIIIQQLSRLNENEHQKLGSSAYTSALAQLADAQEPYYKSSNLCNANIAWNKKRGQSRLILIVNEDTLENNLNLSDEIIQKIHTQDILLIVLVIDDPHTMQLVNTTYSSTTTQSPISLLQEFKDSIHIIRLSKLIDCVVSPAKIEEICTPILTKLSITIDIPGFCITEGIDAQNMNTYVSNSQINNNTAILENVMTQTDIICPFRRDVLYCSYIDEFGAFITTKERILFLLEQIPSNNNNGNDNENSGNGVIVKDINSRLKGTIFMTFFDMEGKSRSVIIHMDEINNKDINKKNKNINNNINNINNNDYSEIGSSNMEWIVVDEYDNDNDDDYDNSNNNNGYAFNDPLVTRTGSGSGPKTKSRHVMDFNSPIDGTTDLTSSGDDDYDDSSNSDNDEDEDDDDFEIVYAERNERVTRRPAATTTATYPSIESNNRNGTRARSGTGTGIVTSSDSNQIHSNSEEILEAEAESNTNTNTNGVYESSSIRQVLLVIEYRSALNSIRAPLLQTLHDIMIRNHQNNRKQRQDQHHLHGNEQPLCDDDDDDIDDTPADIDIVPTVNHIVRGIYEDSPEDSVPGSGSVCCFRPPRLSVMCPIQSLSQSPTSSSSSSSSSSNSSSSSLLGSYTSSSCLRLPLRLRRTHATSLPSSLFKTRSSYLPHHHHHRPSRSSSMCTCVCLPGCSGSSKSCSFRPSPSSSSSSSASLVLPVQALYSHFLHRYRCSYCYHHHCHHYCDHNRNNHRCQLMKDCKQRQCGHGHGHGHGHGLPWTLSNAMTASLEGEGGRVGSGGADAGLYCSDTTELTDTVNLLSTLVEHTQRHFKECPELMRNETVQSDYEYVLELLAITIDIANKMSPVMQINQMIPDCLRCDVTAAIKVTAATAAAASMLMTPLTTCLCFSVNNNNHNNNNINNSNNNDHFIDENILLE